MYKITIMGFFLLVKAFSLSSQDIRKEFIVPGIFGYHTFKGDFHMHTIFSDGQVLPQVRVEEAWREGLDVIAITDHLEYWNKMLPTDKNLPYNLAKSSAKERNILLINGGEITRNLPDECGHMNALFLKDANKLVQKDYMDAINEAVKQGAILIWNHPGWYVHQPDTTIWFDIFTRLLVEGKMHGIEVVNWKRWFPKALDWCLEKNLTIFANSDIEPLTSWTYDFCKGDHRPMTLIFATENTEAAIYEAIQEGRTAAYFKRGFYNQLMGEEKYIKELFFASIDIKIINETEKNIKLIIKNKSDLDFYLIKNNPDERLNYRKEYFLYGMSQEELSVLKSEMVPSSEIYLHFIVKNLMISSNKSLEVKIPVIISK
jgi:hypothetical protein